ncbi:MAG: FAD-dependent oxidoreductase [Thermoanaerobacteraceae bacterium]|nr:FAD-dependent oxidoreductase [Thermoanaerobacteraceae bacterium]
MTAEEICRVKQSEDLVHSYLQEKGLCAPCRRYFRRIGQSLAGIREGSAPPGILEDMENMAGVISASCRCGRGENMARALLAAWREHRDDFIVHIENRVCPAGQCPRLIPAPCQAACPAGIDIPNYVALVGQGRYREALELIREDVPLPGVLGRICEHPCQQACRRGQVDNPIPICNLKRLAYDRGAENETPPSPERKHPERVAVVGAGPAGLSCAYFLARRGYGVTIFEAMSEPGGMLAYGIPPYRLPRDVLRAEVAYIQALGVEIKLNHPIDGGKAVAGLLKEGYAAVFLGTGAWQGSLPVSGAEKYKNVMEGVAFLRQVNESLLKGEGHGPMDLRGKKVVVVGGGNVAVDAARVCLRLGAKEVRIVYRRTSQEMPALPEEIEAARMEGVIFDFLVSPTGVGGAGDVATCLDCVRNVLGEPDARGRRKPVPLQDSDFKIEADLIIFAVGQKPDLSFLDGLEVDVSGDRIGVDPGTMQTSLPGVFAGGDAVTGPASAIRAMAAGKRAALAIDAYLQGRDPEASLRYPVKRKAANLIPVDAARKARSGRDYFHHLYLPGQKDTFAEVMGGLDPADALMEAGRCLRCDLCIACGKCMHSCREVGADALQLGYVDGAGDCGTDFLRSGDRCIGCGTCAVNCPTGAITVEDKAGVREIRLGGGLVSRMDLVACTVCGRPFATAKQIVRLKELVGEQDAGWQRQDWFVCPACARKIWPGKIHGPLIS